jgi:hypothetical protein
MKESTLIKMQKDIQLTQKALAVALYKIEQLEKENDNRRKNTEDSGVQDLDSEKEG